MSGQDITIRRLFDAEDPALRELSALLDMVFADPDVVLELDRMQAFLARQEGASDREFCVLVAAARGVVVGGSVFSYVPASNCGFSEYLVARKDRHGRGIGRRLFDARRAVLDELALEFRQTTCGGLFIEADNPDRTPAALQARERETAMDALTRLQVFDHFGFRRVDMDYAQPPLGPGKRPVTYLDLLFAAWNARLREQRRVPVEWVTETLCPIWQSWAPTTASQACAALREQLTEPWLPLVPLRP